jgi:hypothetical protein
LAASNSTLAASNVTAAAGAGSNTTVAAATKTSAAATTGAKGAGNTNDKPNAQAGSNLDTIIEDLTGLEIGKFIRDLPVLEGRKGKKTKNATATVRSPRVLSNMKLIVFSQAAAGNGAGATKAGKGKASATAVSLCPVKPNFILLTSIIGCSICFCRRREFPLG